MKCLYPRIAATLGTIPIAFDKDKKRNFAASMPAIDNRLAEVTKVASLINASLRMMSIFG